MKTRLWMLAAILGAMAVAFGAMGAHFLKDKITSESLQTFETAVRYQMYHVFALIAVSLLSEKIHSSLLNISGIFFMIGIVLFSGSLYVLSLRTVIGMHETQLHWMGAVTPFGGLAFIGGWITLFFSVLKSKL